MPGERHPNARLTDGAVREMRARHSRGDLLDDLATEFSVSRGTVEKAVYRSTWKHL